MDLIFRIFGLLAILLDKILQPVFWLQRCRWQKKLPPIDNRVLVLSATELAAKIRQKKLSSHYVVSTYITRIKQVNPIVNAVTDERFKTALKDAKAADDFIAKTKISEAILVKNKPFLGVPITIKESCGVKDMSYSVGSLKRKESKCAADGASVQRLKKAGFIVLAVTNCPEYCAALETENLLNGRTKNPYNTHYSVAGSSGGEAAIIGSGASVAGVGSDYAGSIRVPCSFSGIFGHKTTPRIIPHTMHFPNSTDSAFCSYIAIGPMCRYASDLKPMLKVMSADEGKCLELDKKVDLSQVKVLYTEEYYNMLGIVPVSQEIIEAISKSVKTLRKNFNMKSEVVTFKGMENSVEIGTSLYLELNERPNFMQDPNNPKKNRNLYMEIIKSLCGMSDLSIQLLLAELVIRYNAFLPRRHLPYYKLKMAELQKIVWNKLSDNSVLLYPTFSTPAIQHYQIFTRISSITYAMIFNILGCPSTQVPIGLNKDGLPVGIQVVAGPKQDRLCLAVAEALEKSFGGWACPE